MLQRLRELRRKKRLTQQQVAEEIGISPQRYCHYENSNSQPDLETLIRLARFFNVSVDYLLCNAQESLVLDPVEQELYSLLKRIPREQREQLAHLSGEELFFLRLMDALPRENWKSLLCMGPQDVQLLEYMHAMGINRDHMLSVLMQLPQEATEEIRKFVLFIMESCYGETTAVV